VTRQYKGRIVNGLVGICERKSEWRTGHGVQLFDARLECLGQESVIKCLNT
jgi:hypothetical protein